MPPMRVRLLGGIALLLVTASVSAYPPFLERLKTTYPAVEGSALSRANCVVCHTGVRGGARNTYGKTVGAALAKAGEASLTAALLKSVENADSDGDSFANGLEISKGTLPGDASSRVAAEPPKGGQTNPPAAPLIPIHSFHPLLVHFPIALFLFGALIEALGIRKRSESLRQLAFYNLAAGALTSLATVPTGLAAALRGGHDLTPGTQVFGHFVGGILATVTMLAVAGWRRQAAPTTAAYLTLLALACGLVAAAGHFGGMLVYG